MKKSLLLIFAFFAFMLCNAQVKTLSDYDVIIHFKNGTSVQYPVDDIDRITHEECRDTDPYNGHEYVDLGLPSGLKWATCNIGADSPNECGDYFAWGATEPQEFYAWFFTPYQTQPDLQDFSFATYTKYLGSTISSYKDPNATDADALKTVLDLEDDAAHVNWGGEWRMPTNEELVELIDNCYWKLGYHNNEITVIGYIVYKVKDSADKGKRTNDYSRYSPVGSYSASDPHIFLPAVGFRCEDNLSEFNNFGNYWSSSLNLNYPASAYMLEFDKKYVYSHHCNRLYGLTIRPVCP